MNTPKYEHSDTYYVKDYLERKPVGTRFTCSGLAEKLALRSSSVSHCLSDMVKQGYLRRPDGSQLNRYVIAKNVSDYVVRDKGEKKLKADGFSDEQIAEIMKARRKAASAKKRFYKQVPEEPVDDFEEIEPAKAPDRQLNLPLPEVTDEMQIEALAGRIIEIASAKREQPSRFDITAVSDPVLYAEVARRASARAGA